MSLDGSRLQIVAELTTNHLGDRAVLEELIRLSLAAGASHVKLQKRDVASFYTGDQLRAPYQSPFGSTFADYRFGIELGRDDFEFVDRLCADIGISWFCSVLDVPSFRFIREFDPTIIKLPSTISNRTELIEHVSHNFRGVVVASTGMTKPDYETYLVDRFAQSAGLVLMHTTSTYPTPVQDCNIAVLRHYRDLASRFKTVVPGYSSHDIGWFASALAVAAGAKVLEKHVKLGSTPWAHFGDVAVDLRTDGFREYVAQAYAAEVVMGSETKRIMPSEHHKYPL